MGTEGTASVGASETDDLLAPDVIADPYGYFGSLRDSDPVHWNPRLKMWVVTRHSDVVRMTRGHEQFSSDIPLSAAPEELSPPIDERDWNLVENFWAQLRNLADLDRPEHLAVRQTVHRWFTPRAIEKWRHGLRDSTRERIERLLSANQMEVKKDLAVWPPLTTICLMLEVPNADATHLRDLSATIVEFEGTRPDRGRRAAEALRELREYFEPLVEARKRDGTGADLVSMLADGEVRGVLTREECIANIVLLLIAGHDTTMNLISNGCAALIRNPDQWDLLASDPEGLCASATEECLRYEPSIKLALRRCLEDVELGEKEIAAGDLVLWVASSANRDPAVFENPDRFDIRRSPNPHVSFGGGIHHCLGASLARVEAQETFRALVETMPRPRLLDDTIEYETNMLFRTPKALNITWD